MTILEANRLANQMNGLGDFTVEDGIKIANAATEMFTNVWDVTKNKNTVNPTTTNPQVYYVQQQTPSSSQGTYNPYYQQQDNTLMYVALAGLGLLAVMMFTKKK